MMNIIIEDGKYEYRFYPDGNSEVLRYGEPWRDTVGDKLMYCMASEIKQLRAKVAELEAKLAKYDNLEPVAYYTCQGNWPRIVLAIDGNADGYEIPLYALEK